MDISKYDKADVLRVLYNYARPKGLGFLHHTKEKMTKEQAQEMLDSGKTYFDYVGGRVMKIDLSTNELWTGLYNRDNGPQSAEYAINTLETKND